MIGLHLALLGSPEITVGDRPLRFATRKTLALLVYLAVEGGQHPRDKLMAVLWPESEPQRGRGALRITLHYLRRALDEVYPESSREWLQISADTVGINPQAPLETDIAFLQSVAHQRPGNNPPDMQKIIDTYRGPFLDGFSLADAPEFDTWLTIQREVCHQQLSLLFHHLSDYQFDSRQYAPAMMTAERWIAHDPYNEAAYRRLMECHALSGNKSAARQAYNACQRRLTEDLGIQPSAETQTLMANILAEQVNARPVTITPPEINDVLPFVGRQEEFKRLTALFHLTRQNRPQAAIVAGEPGIGKTRLVTEFLHWAAVQGGQVVSGRAFESGGRLPYQPVVDALRSPLENINAPEDLLGDVWLAELSRILPELRERYPDLEPSPGDDPAARTRLMEAAARLLTALAQGKPRHGKTSLSSTLLLFIDDLQWADNATLDMLHYALHAWVKQSLPIFLLFTIRPEEVPENPVMGEWLVRLPRLIPVTRLDLAFITAAETAELVNLLPGRLRSAALPVSNKNEFASWLFRETAGQPFFINETILVLRDVDGHGETGWLNRPEQRLEIPGIHQLILSRLNRLNPAALQLLYAAAVLARPATYTRLCRIAGVDEDAGLVALETLLRNQLIVEHPENTQPYTISHDKIRDVVYAQATNARRRLYHRRALTVLEAEQALPAELAHHALAAHLTKPALRYSLAAGDEALALFAVREAIFHYEQAHFLLGEQATANDSRSVGQLYTNLGRAYELAGDYDHAQATGHEMLLLAEKVTDPEMASSALNRMAGLAIYTHHLEDAAAYLAQAQELAQQHNQPRLAAETEWTLAQLTHHQYDMVASKEHSLRTLALAQEMGDAHLIGGSLNNLGYAQMMLGELIAAGETMEAARLHFATLKNRALEADCLTGLGGILIFQGRSWEGLPFIRQGLAIYQDIDNPWGILFSSGWLAAGLIDRGRYEEAIDAVLEPAGLAKNLPPTPVTIWNRLWAGNAYRALNRLDEALAAHQEAAAQNADAPLPAFAWYIAAECCADAVMGGDWPAAARFARQALQLCFYDVLPQIVLPIWTVTAALLPAGDIELAREAAERIGRLWSRHPRFRVAHFRSLAVLAAGDGDPAGALAYLEEAYQLAKQCRLPGEQAQIQAEINSALQYAQ